jgi:uncharacterized protein (TIGR03083 family)
MDYIWHFHREAQAFLAAARRAVTDEPAPAVRSCPGWTMTELVLHLGYVHRSVAQIISERLIQRPERADLSWLGLGAEDTARLGELMAERTDGRATSKPPSGRPLPATLVEWFGAGAAELETQFRTTPPGEQVWTWSADQTAGFWQRMQAIEAAIHRWDAESAVGSPGPIHPELAVDAVTQTFEVMAPMRRAIMQAPRGRGERFRFVRTDGPGAWAVRFDGDDVILGDPDDACHVTLTGTASELALFLWHRGGTVSPHVQGQADLAEHYFDLVPPV